MTPKSEPKVYKTTNNSSFFITGLEKSELCLDLLIKSIIFAVESKS